MKNTEITMKRLPLFKHLALACSLAVLASLTVSCSSVKDPAVRADQFTAAAPAAMVYSHNAASNPNTRSCDEVGPLPENTARAIAMWLRGSTVKSFSYVNPQYYISLPTGTGKAPRVWGICSDGQGNLVGLLIPRDGVAAWNLPNLGSYNVYVNDTLERKALSDAIMEALADAGYDAPRINALTASGLSATEDKDYLISKPLTDTEKQRREEERRKKEAAEKAAAEKAAAAETSSSAADSLETTADDDTAETATPVADADDEDETPAADDDDTDSSSDDDSAADDDDAASDDDE